MAAEKTYRAGIIGVGRKGHGHARGYAGNPRTEVVAAADPDDPVEENDPIPAAALLAVGRISAVPAGIVPTANAVDPAKATSRAPSAAMPKKIPFNTGGFRAALFLCLQPFPIASVC